MTGHGLAEKESSALGPRPWVTQTSLTCKRSSWFTDPDSPLDFPGEDPLIPEGMWPSRNPREGAGTTPCPPLPVTQIPGTSHPPREAISNSGTSSCVSGLGERNGPTAVYSPAPYEAQK